MGSVLASMEAYVASQERQNIIWRTRAGLDSAGVRGVELGGRWRLTDEQLIAIRLDLEKVRRSPRRPGSTACLGPRSAAPEAGRREVDQAAVW